MQTRTAIFIGLLALSGCLDSTSSEPIEAEGTDGTSFGLTTSNLFVNPSFETSTSGWGSWQGSISRVAIAGAPDGAYVAKVTRSSGTAYSIDDATDVVRSVPAGTSYTASGYVRAASASAVGKPVKLIVREWANGSETNRFSSQTVNLSNTWQKLVVNQASPVAGRSLDVFVLQSSATAGDAFYADAFELRTIAPPVADAGTPTTDSGAPPPSDAGTPPPSGQAMFVGDYSTGNFAQWLTVQTKSYNDKGSGWPGTTYPATIVNDPAKGKVARFEVRQGDVVASGERSEVRGAESLTGGGEGDVRWFAFSTKFDSSFYTTWGQSEWGVTNQWHAEDFINGYVSPPIAFGYSGWGGHQGGWELIIKTSGTGNVIWNTPMAVGTWHDIKMMIKWSKNPAVGQIRLWHNGVPQTFSTGGTTWTGQTMSPGSASNYYKEGLYRASRAQTGVVFHTGFKVATTEAGLL